MAVEVEICVICEIEDSRSICLSCDGQAKFAVLCPLISRNSLEGTRITLLTILGEIKKLDTALVLTAFPYLVLETLRTAMKMVRTIVNRKSIFRSVKSELAKCDTVGVTSGNLSCTRTVTKIIHRVIISQDNICKHSILVRNNHGHDSCTYIRKLHISAFFILKSISEYLFSTRGLAPKLL